MIRLFPFLLMLLVALPARAEVPFSARVLSAIDCMRAAPESVALFDCAAPLADGVAVHAATSCLLRGEGPVACLGMREAGLLSACLASAGISAEGIGSCVAWRLVMREASKCLSTGIGVAGGCLGPNNTLRQWGEAGVAAWRGRDTLLARLPSF